METNEELNVLKEEAEIELHELTDEELSQVSGGMRLPDVKPIIDTSSTNTVVE